MGFPNGEGRRPCRGNNSLVKRQVLFWLMVLCTALYAAPTLVIGTGAPGGVYLSYGAKLASIVGLSPRQSAGSVENLKLIRSGEAQLGLTTVDSALDAVQGKGAYVDGGPVPVQAMAVLYPSMLHVVTLESSSLRTLADLSGRRVSLGSPGSSSQTAAGRLLRIAKIPVIPSFLSIQDATRALQAGEIDAFCWINGLPCVAIANMKQPVRLLDATPHLQELVKLYGPLYTEAAIPGGTYPGCPDEARAISLNNILVCSTALSEDAVYGLLTTMFDQMEQVRGIHPSAARLNKTYCSQGSSIDFHPGARRFYSK